MKNLTFYLIAILFMSSCSATWHVNRAEEIDPSLFEQKIDTTITVIKRDSIFHLDTNISITLPRDTITIEKLIPISRNFDKIIKKQGIITTEVEAIKGMLKVNSYLDSSFIYNLQTEIRIKNAIITNLKQVTKEQTVTIKEQENKLKWYQKALKWGKWILIVVVIVLLLGFGYKFYKWIK